MFIDWNRTKWLSPFGGADCLLMNTVYLSSAPPNGGGSSLDL